MVQHHTMYLVRFLTRDLKQALVFAVFTCSLLFFSVVPSPAEALSPFRHFYPDIKTISTAELSERFWMFTLVDIRQPFEFDVAHISTSVNLPFNKDEFTRALKKFESLRNSIELVLIDNSPDCSRGFKAARIAKSLGMENVFVYDAGVSFWLYLFPEKSTLMGETPARPGKVLPLSRYQTRLISFQHFYLLSQKENAIVIDIRDIFHRRDIPQGIEIKNIAMESLLEAINSRVWSEKLLLFFDSDGSSTRLLQFFLQAGGYYNYFFLEGGINGVPQEMQARIPHRANEQVSVNQMRLHDAAALVWKHKRCSAFLNYIISSLRFENYAFIEAEQAIKEL